MSTEKEKRFFWTDEEWKGKAVGGLFYRCDLFKWIKQAEESGVKVVGIVIDGTWDMELIIELKDPNLPNPFNRNEMLQSK